MMEDLSKYFVGMSEGTALWSPLYGDVTFVRYTDSWFAIHLRTANGEDVQLTRYGQRYGRYPNEGSLIFPSKKSKSWRSRRCG